MDYDEAAGASGEVQTYQLRGPGGAGPDGGGGRTQETFYDGHTTSRVTTETSQQQFGSTTVTKVRREEVSTSGGWPSQNTAQRHVHYEQESIGASQPGGATGSGGGGGGGATASTFNVSKFGSTTQQRKPDIWAPSGAGGGRLTISTPEGVHVQQNADQSITMSFGLASPRQQGMASPRQQETCRSQQQQHDPSRHVPQFNVSKVGGSRPGIWAPGGGGDVPVLRPFAVEAPKWSPTPKRKPEPPETAPKPQRPPERESLSLAYDESDAVPRWSTT